MGMTFSGETPVRRYRYCYMRRRRIDLLGNIDIEIAIHSNVDCYVLNYTLALKFVVVFVI